MPPQLFLITVFIPLHEEPLRFKVTNFKNEKGRVQFIDRLTGLTKNFPSEICLIEGVEK